MSGRLRRAIAGTSPATRGWLLFVSVLAGYVIGYKLAQDWFSTEDQGASFFPAAGVTLGALVLVSRRLWPVVLAAAALGELTLDLANGTGFVSSLGYTVANVVQPLAGALLLTTLVPHVDLRRTRDLAAFLGSGVLFAPVVGALVAAATWSLVDDRGGTARFAFEWWSGDGLGILVVGGALISLRAAKPLPRPRAVEGVLLAALAVAATAAIFRLGWFEFVYLPIALLVVIAFRLGTTGVALTSAVVAFAAAAATAEAQDFWASIDVSAANRILYLQLALGIVIAAVLALASEISEREQMALDLARVDSERAAAVEHARLFDAERAARERAQILERNAGHLAAAATAAEVAACTVGDLKSSGIPIAGVESLLDDAATVRALAVTGVDAETTARFVDYPLESETPGAHVIRTGSTLDVERGEDYDALFPTTAPLRARHAAESFFAVPLRSADGRILGAVSVAAPEPGAFDAVRKGLVTAIAEQTALALERASLLERERAARTHAEQDERVAVQLQQVTVALAAAETALDVAHVVVTRLIAALGGTGGMLYVLDERAGMLRLVEQASTEDEVVEGYRTIALDRRLPPTDALRSESAILLRSLDAVRAAYPELAEELGLGAGDRSSAWAVIPLVAGVRPVGVLLVRYADPQRFDESQRLALLTMGEAVAQALRRAELYEAERDARRRAELLERSAAHLAQSGTVLEVAQSTIEDLSDAGMAIAFVGVLEGGAVRTVASAGVPAETSARDPLVPLDRDTILTEVVRTGMPMSVRSSADYDARFPGGVDIRTETGVESAFAAPLRGTDGRVLGSLVVGAREPAWFDEERGQLIVAIADQCGLAVERALLYEAELEARRAADRRLATLSLLNQAAGRLAGAVSAAEVARILVDDALRAFGSARGLVALSRRGEADLEVVAASASPSPPAADLPAGVLDAYASGQPVWLEAAGPDGVQAGEGAGAALTGAFVPLPGDQRPLGVLAVEFGTPHVFAPDELDLLTTLGRQGALALERASFFEREQEARRRAQLLERHSGRLAAAATTLEVAETTIADLESVGVDAAWVQLVDGDSLELLTHSGLPEENVEQYGRYPLDRRTPPAQAARTGRIVDVGTGAELDESFPDAAAGRARIGYESMIAAPLRAAGGRTLGVLTFVTTEQHWLATGRRLLVAGLAEQCGLALERAQLQAEADVAARDAALLARLGEVLERATGTRERAQALAATVARELDALAIVHLVDDGGALEVVAEEGGTLAPDVDDAALGRLAQRALESGGPVQDDLDDACLMSAALRARDRVLGVLTLGGPLGPANRLTTVLLQRVATRAAVALDNAFLYEQERDVSHTLQLGLLGGELASTPDAAIATAYRPGTAMLEVGGDWYDAFTLPDGRLALLVGDVVGHGLEAAVAMGQLRGAVRALAPLGSPAQVLERLDDVVETLPQAAMATLAYVELDPEDGRIWFACAGHPPPILVPASGQPRYLWDGRSAPLGSSLAGDRVEATETLEPGDALVLYTDGLVERRRVSLSDRLDALLDAVRGHAGTAPDDLVDAILTACLDEGTQEDDVCILALRRISVGQRFAHTLPAAREEIARMRRELTAWLRTVDLEPGRRPDVVLAVSEAVANAAEHAYGFDGSGIVRVEVWVDDGDLEVLVSDQGSWREPREGNERGRGRTIMQALMRDVVISAGERGTTVRMSTPVRTSTAH